MCRFLIGFFDFNSVAIIGTLCLLCITLIIRCENAILTGGCIRSCNGFIYCLCNRLNDLGDSLFCRCRISYFVYKKECALRIVAGNNLSGLLGLNNAICKVHT